MGKTPLRCNFLNTEAVLEINRNGRWILEHVGVRIQESAFIDKSKAAGARVDRKSQIVKFPPALLDDILSQVPTRFVLYSRDGKNDIHLNTGKVYFANGGRVFRILDMSTGNWRTTKLKDVACTATLVNCLDHVHVYIIACHAHDLERQYYHLNDFYHAFNHTTKHVMSGCENLRGVKQMWKLAGFIAGGKDNIRKRPWVSVITNPISPLTFDSDMLQVLDFCATNGIPVTCAPAPIAGTTSPVTLAGTLSQMHAEALAGVALAQLCAPGAKVLYGAVPSTMDLRNLELAMGSVEMAMMNAVAVQLAKLYQLSIYASGGVTEAKGPDIQAGCEKSFSNLLVAMNGADLIHLAAGMLDSGNSIAYEQLVIDDEIIGMIERIIGGITVNRATLAPDVIKKVFPDGNFVIEEHTVEHMMTEYFYPNLSVRCNFDVWEQRSRPSMLSRAKEQVDRILAENDQGLLEPELILEIQKRFPGIQNL
jgi:trimethylamine--corrinoid protein Co-methyltransferase